MAELIKPLINRHIVKRDINILIWFLNVLLFFGYKNEKRIKKFLDRAIEYRIRKWVN
jgi:hypothetical protein